MSTTPTHPPDAPKMWRRLLSRTHPDPDELEESWKASVRAHHTRLRDANRWAWIRHFDRMAASHAAISEHYTARAEALLEDGR